MKPLNLITAACFALTALSFPAAADPWKNEGGHGRWGKRYEQREKYWKPRGPHRAHPHERQGYWNGYRGYREHRRGYRRHNDGWWYPLAAFGAGVIIGETVARPAPAHRPAPAYRSADSAHEEWCYSRYRSYRAYDNTFQPYYGPRRECISPY